VCLPWYYFCCGIVAPGSLRAFEPGSRLTDEEPVFCLVLFARRGFEKRQAKFF
jgi:hypothetical protein